MFHLIVSSKSLLLSCQRKLVALTLRTSFYTTSLLFSINAYVNFIYHSTCTVPDDSGLQNGLRYSWFELFALLLPSFFSNKRRLCFFCKNNLARVIGGLAKLKSPRIPGFLCSWRTQKHELSLSIFLLPNYFSQSI